MHQMAALTPVRVGGASRRAPSTRRTQTVVASAEPKLVKASKAAVGAMVSGLVAALPARALSYDEMMAANQAKGPSIKGLVKRSAASVPSPEVPVEAPSMPEMPSLKLPQMPQLKLPDAPPMAETVVPEVTTKLSAPEMRAARMAARKAAEGATPAPEVAMPEVAKIEVPEVKVELPFKFEAPKFEMPKIEVPEMKVVPKVEAPVSTESAKFQIPTEWLEATPKKLVVPKVEAPPIEIPTPIVQVPTPMVQVPVPKAKVEIVMPDGFELPTAPKAPAPELPDIKLPEFKAPDVDINGMFSKMSEGLSKEVQKEFGGLAPPKVNAPKVELPNVQLPKVELPKVELPTAAVSDALASFKSQFGSSTEAARQAASKAGGGLSQEFNKEFGGAMDAVNKVKGSATDAVSGAASSVTSSVTVQTDAISSSVGKSLSAGAAFVAQFLPPEIVELLTKATGDPDLAVAVTAAFLGTPVAALLLLRLAGSVGFAGSKSPAQAEAALYTGGALLLDVRSLQERVAQGVPDLRGKARGKATVFSAVPLDGKTRGKLKSAGDVELAIFAFGARALAKGRPVYILTAGGGGKEYARAMSKLGCKAFVVEGGLKGWAAAGLRTKPTYTVSVADVIKEEAQQLAAPLLQGTAGAAGGLKDEDLTKYAAIAVGSGVALYNYEVLLEVIGIWGIVLTLAIRSLKAEGGIGGIGGEVAGFFSGAVTTAQGTIGAATEMAGSLSSKVIAPEEKAIEKKK